MLEHDVHRVLVMDEKFNLYGIITSFDFVRVIAEGIMRERRIASGSTQFATNWPSSRPSRFIFL